VGRRDRQGCGSAPARKEISMNRILVATLSAAALAAGCAKQEAKTEPVRPVRTVVVGERDAQALVLAGEVHARYETRLAFRVGGQMVARRVDAGAVVRAGQPLAQIDTRDLQLAEAAARAQLAQVESSAALADADLRRYADLRARNFISQAEFDRREATAQQAREQLAAARAQAVQAGNQAAYGVLVAPHGGVITAVETEAGQVVTPGQTIVRLARPEEKEVLIAVPENKLDALRRAAEIEVRLWAAPDRVYRGRLRELSPAADPSSRTYSARIAIDNEDAAVVLGMSAEVRAHLSGTAEPRIPLTALFHRDGAPAVWVVGGRPATVRLVRVTTGDVSGDLVAVTSGLKPGDVVVTAGVQLLRESQPVTLLAAAPAAPQP
jgi:RND family efflux transporter MFP subunit